MTRNAGRFAISARVRSGPLVPGITTSVSSTSISPVLLEQRERLGGVGRDQHGVAAALENASAQLAQPLRIVHQQYRRVRRTLRRRAWRLEEARHS